jgi:hypothetical protein
MSVTGARRKPALKGHVVIIGSGSSGGTLATHPVPQDRGAEVIGRTSWLERPQSPNTEHSSVTEGATPILVPQWRITPSQVTRC